MRDRIPYGPMCCSVHIHTTLCDGKGTPEAMAEAAYRAGVRYLGFSGHSHTECASDRGYVLPEDLTEYRTRVLALREAYGDRMEILLGIELDSFSQTDPADLDYWIGSVHHLPDGRGGDYAVDAAPEEFFRCRDALFHGDVYAMAEAYYTAVGEMARRKPTILGHLDLITKYNQNGAIFDETHPRYRSAALGALQAADPSGTLLEINTGAMSRGYRREPYPALFLLKAWRQRGGQVILTADAHSPEAIVYAYDAAADRARAAGYRECAVLTASGVKLCSLEGEANL